jgi:predicted dehydrogenase
MSARATPLRAAVIGGGVISKEHLGFLGHRESVTLVGVCDVSPAAAEFARSRSGAARAFTDVDEMLKATEPDVVHVLTPPHTHLPLVEAALRAGAHVICEKPLAPTARELRAALAIAEEADRHLVESHNYRFNETIRAVRLAVDRGEIGAVRDVDVRIALDLRAPGGRFSDQNLPSPIHAMPAGVIHDFITHMAYLALHFSPVERFERIAAAWSNHGGGSLFRYDDLDALAVATPAAGAPVHVRFRFSCHTLPECFTVTVRGATGWAETDLFQPYLRVVRPRPGGRQLSPVVNHIANGASLAASGVRNVRNKLMQHGPYEGLARFLGETYDALERGAPPPVSPHDMLAAADLVDALLDEAVRL